MEIHRICFKTPKLWFNENRLSAKVRRQKLQRKTSYTSHRECQKGKLFKTIGIRCKSENRKSCRRFVMDIIMSNLESGEDDRWQMTIERVYLFIKSTSITPSCYRRHISCIDTVNVTHFPVHHYLLTLQHSWYYHWE